MTASVRSNRREIPLDYHQSVRAYPHALGIPLDAVVRNQSHIINRSDDECVTPSQLRPRPIPSRI